MVKGTCFQHPLLGVLLKAFGDQFLRDYFYAGGEGPVPIEILQNQKYRDVVSIRLYYDWHT
jgi:hypothetical protein